MLALYKHTLVPDLAGLEGHIGSPKLIVDIGAGIRPATWVNARRHICVEPCHVYAEILRDNGYEVIETEAADGIYSAPYADMILMLDVIEHMEREDANSAIGCAMMRSDRVMIYTPNGFVPQDEDKWGLGQVEWQTHRSGWTPDDFDGWKIIEGKEGFAAIYG